jgi:hypothetical protein
LPPPPLLVGEVEGAIRATQKGSVHDGSIHVDATGDLDLGLDDAHQ